MKNIFISQPMAGKSIDEIVAERKIILDKIAEKEFIVMDTVFKDVENALECLGMSLIALSKADLAVFAPGWEKARGCRIEHQCAVDYGIPIIELEEE